VSQIQEIFNTKDWNEKLSIDEKSTYHDMKNMLKEDGMTVSKVIIRLQDRYMTERVPESEVENPFDDEMLSKRGVWNQFETPGFKDFVTLEEPNAQKDGEVRAEIAAGFFDTMLEKVKTSVNEVQHFIQVEDGKIEKVMLVGTKITDDKREYVNPLAFQATFKVNNWGPSYQKEMTEFFVHREEYLMDEVYKGVVIIEGGKKRCELPNKNPLTLEDLDLEDPECNLNVAALGYGAPVAHPEDNLPPAENRLNPNEVKPGYAKGWRKDNDEESKFKQIFDRLG